MSPGLTGTAASRRRGLELDTILQAANAWAVKLGHFLAGPGRPSIDPEGHLAPHPARGELLVLGGRLRVVYQLAGDVYVLVVQEPGASVILGATLGNAVLGSLAAAFKGRGRGKGKGWEVSAERLHDDFNSTYKAVRRALVMDALPQAEFTLKTPVLLDSRGAACCPRKQGAQTRGAEGGAGGGPALAPTELSRGCARRARSQSEEGLLWFSLANGGAEGTDWRRHLTPCTRGARWRSPHFPSAASAGARLTGTSCLRASPD